MSLSQEDITLEAIELRKKEDTLKWLFKPASL
jgi:hypothetical protein